MSSADALPTDARDELCAAERRIILLRIFNELDGEPVDARFLADALSFIESGGVTPDDDARTTAKRTLHHIHLPLLVEHGVVETDTDLPTADDETPRTTIVRPTPLAARLLEWYEQSTARGGHDA